MTGWVFFRAATNGGDAARYADAYLYAVPLLLVLLMGAMWLTVKLARVMPARQARTVHAH